MEFFVDPYKLFPDVCDTRWYEEQRAKNIYHHEKRYIYIYIYIYIFIYIYWNFCFYRPLRSQETIRSFAPRLWNYLVDPYNLFPDIWQVRQKEEKQAKSFSSLEWLPLFQNLLFSIASQILKNCSYNFQSNCQNIFWTIKNCSLMFVTLDDTRNNGPKTFVTVKTDILKCLFLSTS